MPVNPALESGRLDLLRQLGLTTRNAPPCWRDDNDPSVKQQKLRSAKKSVQIGYVDTIAQPRQRRERAEITGAAPTYLDTLTLHQDELPGPGTYYKDDINNMISGGRFNKGHPKSDIEFIELDAKQKPGPGQYGELRITNRGLNLQGKAAIKFGQSDRLSELDVLQNRARQTPGPGANGFVDGPRPHIGAKFNLAVVPTELDLIERNSKKSPAPHDYGCPHKLSVAGGGQFSTAFPPSSLEAVVRSKKDIPGPASYDPPIPQNKYAGRCPMGRTPGEEERRLHLAALIPGPGAYEIKLTRVGKSILNQNPGVTKWPQVKRREPKPKLPSPYLAPPKKQMRKDKPGKSVAESYGSDEFEDKKGLQNDVEESYGSDEFK